MSDFDDSTPEKSEITRRLEEAHEQAMLDWAAGQAYTDDLRDEEGWMLGNLDRHFWTNASTGDIIHSCYTSPGRVACFGEQREAERRANGDSAQYHGAIPAADFFELASIEWK